MYTGRTSSAIGYQTEMTQEGVRLVNRMQIELARGTKGISMMKYDILQQPPKHVRVSYGDSPEHLFINTSQMLWWSNQDKPLQATSPSAGESSAGVIQDKGIPNVVERICTTPLPPPVTCWRHMYSIYICFWQYMATMYIVLVY